jgi:hypothetical protein
MIWILLDIDSLISRERHCLLLNLVELNLLELTVTRNISCYEIYWRTNKIISSTFIFVNYEIYFMDNAIYATFGAKISKSGAEISFSYFIY